MGCISKSVYFNLVLLSIMIIKLVEGRSLRHGFSGLVSDGIDHHHHFQEKQKQKQKQSSVLVFKGIGDYSEENCEQMYGFLPCSESILGNLFLILVYEYLLFHGESYLVSGAEQIFKILGPGVFGASAFHVLGALPEALILLASGLLNSKEVAEEYVFTGVGLLAGSSILLLTLLWGTCLIAASQHFSTTSSVSVANGSSIPRELSFHRVFASLTGFGVTTDLETSYTARIMVLSVIPFLIVQLPKIIPSFSGQHVVLLITLVVSVLFLFMYFFYQIFQPWIQKRRLEYVKHEHLILRILKHVQEHALGKILTDDGAPNVHAIRRLFEEIDQDGDEFISLPELKEVLLGIKFSGMHVDKEQAIAEVVKEFDLNGDQKINKDEFIFGFTKWLNEAKYAVDRQHYSQKSLKDVYRVLKPWIENKRKEHEMKKNLISGILRHAQNNSLGTLLIEDGTPDIPAIKRLFEKFDKDGDNHISEEELKELIEGVKFGEVPLNAEEAVAKLIEEIDTSGDHVISEEEFVNGIAKLLNTPTTPKPPSTETQDDIYQKTWEETDRLVEDEKDKGVVDKSAWGWINALMFMVIGFAILAVLAEPLIHSVQDFSKAANISSFFVSFILVPWATNARAASSAIKAASRKKPRTTSLTFSEIYGGVLMNNILGFSVLLSIIYVRGLTWEYSAEVLVVVIVCAVMGLVASFTYTFPIWTSFMAYLLYPLSLIFVYILNYVLDYV